MVRAILTLVVVAGRVATFVGFLLDGVEHGEPGDLTEALHALFQELPNTSFRCLLDSAICGALEKWVLS